MPLPKVIPAAPKARHPLDFYQTPSQVTKALLRVIQPKGLVLDPTAGDLAISKMFPNVITNDVDSSKSTHFHVDATDPTASIYQTPVDWVVTNPPFSDASTILPLCWRTCTKGMAMLLRLSFLEPCENRSQFLKDNPLTHLIVFNPRPKFRTDTKGSDSVTTAWFVWTKPSFPTQIHFATDWKTL